MIYLLGEIADTFSPWVSGKQWQAFIDKWTYVLDITREELLQLQINTSVLNKPKDTDNIVVLTNDDFIMAAEICIRRMYNDIISTEEAFNRLFSHTFGK